MRRYFLTNGIKNESAGTGCEGYFGVRGLSGTCQITATLFSVCKVIPKNYFLDEIFCICCQMYLTGLLTKGKLIVKQQQRPYLANPCSSLPFCTLHALGSFPICHSFLITDLQLSESSFWSTLSFPFIN